MNLYLVNFLKKDLVNSSDFRANMLNKNQCMRQNVKAAGFNIVWLEVSKPAMEKDG
jgi:hypothetical protein